MTLEIILPQYFYMLPDGSIVKDMPLQNSGVRACYLEITMPDEILIDYAIEGFATPLFFSKGIANGYIKNEYFREYQKRLSRALLPFAKGDLKKCLQDICGELLTSKIAA